MGTAIAALILAAITLMAMRSHVRKSGRSAAACAPDAPGRLCPRCGAGVGAGTLSCPSCRVPLQAYEVVTAKVIRDDVRPTVSAAAPAAERLHALVRADLCVGCGTCVAACPEPGAIQLSGKRAVVNLAFCTGHGKCAAACPVGAIAMSAGDAVQRVEVPEVDTHFETNIPGLYIVGELGGRGLIKNAINEGKIAVEHIAQELNAARGAFGRSGAPDALYLIIVGTGPAGLSAGLEAQRSGLSYAVLERGTLADSIRKYPRRKLLLAEPVKVPLYGDLWVADASKESLIKVWEAIIARTKLDVRTGQEVTHVTRAGESFEVETAGRTMRARRVVLAMGRRGNPRRLGAPGEEMSKVLYDIAEMENFAGRRVLVVGGGDSAVESAVGLSRQPGIEVVLSYRGEDFGRIKPRNQAKLDEVVAKGAVRLLLRSTVRGIRPDAVTLEMGGRSVTLPNDEVIVRIGGEPPYEFLRRVGVRVVKKDVPLVQSADGAANA